MTTLDGNTLSARHLDELKASAISDEQIAERGYQTIINPKALPPAFTGGQRKLSGLLIPIASTIGDTVAWQFKPDSPRTIEGKQAKYEYARGGRVCLDVPTAARAYLLDPEADLWITEGAKKVDSAVSNGIPCTIGVQGVWMWQQNGVALPDWRDIALKGRACIIAFDSDVMTKPGVRKAVRELSQSLAYRGAIVRYCLMPDLPDGAKCGLDDWFASGKSRAGLEALIVDSLPSGESEWPVPLALEAEAGPRFPLECLSGDLEAYVAAVAEETQTPLDLAGCVALGTLSAAARGKYEVAVGVWGWTEPPHLQIVSVLPPAHRKSAVYRDITRPVSDWERGRWPEERTTIREWESKRRVLEKTLASAENGLGNPDKSTKITDPEARWKAALHALQEHEKNEPRLTRIIVDDATPEAVKSLLVEQGGSLAVMSPEAAFLSNIAGRYSDGPNLDILLNGHAADSYTVDRKGRGTETIARACLTVCLTVQPKVISDLGKVDGFVERGGRARLLPAIPASRLGHRRIDVTAVPVELSERWHSTIKAILEHVPARAADSDGNPMPCKLELDQDALAELRHYRTAHERELRRGGTLADIADWAGKLPGAVLRIAGLLHIATHEMPEASKITVGTLRSAIRFGDYFTGHARIMYRMMAGHSNLADAQAVLEAITGLDSPTTRREVHRRLHNTARFQRSADLSDPLAVLEDYGWIRRSHEGKSEMIFLTPLKTHDNDDNAAQSDPAPLPSSSLSSISGDRDRKTTAFDPDRDDVENVTPIRPEPLPPTGTEGDADEWIF